MIQSMVSIDSKVDDGWPWCKGILHILRDEIKIINDSYKWNYKTKIKLILSFFIFDLEINQDHNTLGKL
jgi:hypothetical protein